MLDTLTTEELRAAIANATGDDDAAPECTCAAKDMTFGRCCKVTPNQTANRALCVRLSARLGHTEVSKRNYESNIHRS